MIPEFTLAGKTALITGAGRGIGTGIAEVFAEAGATVIVNALTDKYLNGFAASLQQRTGQRVVPIVGDATHPDSVGDIVNRSLAVTGQIDVLVNNLGDSIRRPLVPLKEGEAGASDEDIQKILALNLIGTIYFSRAVGDDREINIGVLDTEVDIVEANAVRHHDKPHGKTEGK